MGMTPGALYRYFHGTDDLVLAIADRLRSAIVVSCRDGAAQSFQDDGHEDDEADRLGDDEPDLVLGLDDPQHFDLAVRLGGAARSEAHWAQPCVRLSAFMGFDEKTAGNATDYLPRCFVFLDGQPWATLLNGESATREVPPGRHVVAAIRGQAHDAVEIVFE